MQYPPEQSTQVPLWRFLRTEDTTAVVGVTPMAVKRVWIRLFDDSDTYVDVPRESYTAGHFAMLATKVAENHLAVVQTEAPTITLNQ
jgi:hypothetical protein